MESGALIVELLGQVAAWFSDPAHWTGTDGIPNRLLEHLELSGVAVAVGITVALPIGLLIGHSGRGAFLVVSVANIGRAVPSYALLLLLFPIFLFSTPIPALILLAIPPILTNAYVGVREVDRDLIESGRGMGMTGWQVLTGLELPIAVPVIVAGVRTAAVQVVATATIAALVAGGGLGRYIVDGFGLRDQAMIVGGAILVAILAIVVERSLTVVEGLVTSPGIEPRHRRPRAIELRPLGRAAGST
jgi:osmoprotectant transport system permease protein